MAPLKMVRGMANYLVSEAKSMYRSRDQHIVIAGATALVAGQLMGRLTAGTAAATPTAGNTGNPTFGAITVGVDALAGDYRVVFTGPTAYELRNLNGDVLGTGATGTALAGAPLAFTITAGTTAAVAGDSFTIAVTATVGAMKALNLGASDGTQTVAGILMEGIGANVTAERTITKRDAEVNAAHLVYPAGATASQKATINTALAGLGIILR